MKLVLTLIFLVSFSAAAQTGSGTAANDIHFRTFGEGKPVLIINGGPGMDSQGFEFLAQEISKMNFQTIIYDQRGTGKSLLKNPNSDNITMDLMVEDIELLRKKLNVEEWVIFGHSFGGLLATHYAAKYPERIEKLIFSSSGGVNLTFGNYLGKRIQQLLNQQQRDSLNYYQMKIQLGNTSDSFYKKRAEFLANAYVFDDTNAPQIAERLLQVDFKINNLVFQDLNRIKFDYTNQFKNFKQPVLVIQGKDDIITAQTAEEIADSFGNAELVLLNNCGHYGWLDAKDHYFQVIDQFLNKS